MKYNISRQIVTGLVVNSKVNVRCAYYRYARAMCQELFLTGTYRFPGSKDKLDSLSALEGILSHIHHVRDLADTREEIEKRQYSTRRLYARFLKYRYFVGLQRPLLVCEGKTDNIYLKHAIKNLSSFHPKLGEWKGKEFRQSVSFFSYTNSAHRILTIDGGAPPLLYFFIGSRYKRDIEGFKHAPLKFPVIVLIDNDQEAKKIFSTLKENYKLKIDSSSPEPFFHITHNLYLVKTPPKKADSSSYIEDFFEPSVLQTQLQGKKFNPSDKMDPRAEYGKFVFAEKVVRPNAAKINFSGFTPVLLRIVDAIDDYVSKIK